MASVHAEGRSPVCSKKGALYMCLDLAGDVGPCQVHISCEQICEGLCPVLLGMLSCSEGPSHAIVDQKEVPAIKQALFECSLMQHKI